MEEKGEEGWVGGLKNSKIETSGTRGKKSWKKEKEKRWSIVMMEERWSRILGSYSKEVIMS